MKHSLVIFKTSQCWMVDWAQTPEAGKIRSLFNGASILPTAFTALASVEDVLATLKSKNPQYAVEVR